MSHLKERKEKNCLNCNAVVHGKYCSICGQENMEPQETVWHLITHFFNDITHFDGKFFSSLKYLIFRPGFLTSEYVAGRRSSYLNPVRMYVFTSFIFFFIFFSFISVGDEVKPMKVPGGNKKIRDSVFAAIDRMSILDSTEKEKEKDHYDMYTGKTARDFLFRKNMKPSGKAVVSAGSGNVRTSDNHFSFSNADYKSKEEYDSLLRTGVVKDNWLQQMLTRKEIRLNEKYGHDNERISERLIDNFLHSIPQMFFFSLPLFALVLRLLYFRHRQFYYVSHAIFALHLFIFFYIAFLAGAGIGALASVPYLGWLSYVENIITIGVFYYWYKAMKNFYGRGYFKTFLKYFLTLLSMIFIALLAVVVIGIFAYYKS